MLGNYKMKRSMKYHHNPNVNLYFKNIKIQDILKPKKSYKKIKKDAKRKNKNPDPKEFLRMQELENYKYYWDKPVLK